MRLAWFRSGAAHLSSIGLKYCTDVAAEGLPLFIFNCRAGRTRFQHIRIRLLRQVEFATALTKPETKPSNKFGALRSPAFSGWDVAGRVAKVNDKMNHLRITGLRVVS